jgi:hypothetical protein
MAKQFKTVPLVTTVPGPSALSSVGLPYSPRLGPSAVGIGEEVEQALEALEAEGWTVQTIFSHGDTIYARMWRED